MLRLPIGALLLTAFVAGLNLVPAAPRAALPVADPALQGVWRVGDPADRTEHAPFRPAWLAVRLTEPMRARLYWPHDGFCVQRGATVVGHELSVDDFATPITVVMRDRTTATMTVQRGNRTWTHRVTKLHDTIPACDWLLHHGGASSRQGEPALGPVEHSTTRQQMVRIGEADPSGRSSRISSVHATLRAGANGGVANDTRLRSGST